MTERQTSFRFVNPRPRKKRRPNPAWSYNNASSKDFTSVEGGDRTVTQGSESRSPEIQPTHDEEESNNAPDHAVANLEANANFGEESQFTWTRDDFEMVQTLMSTEWQNWEALALPFGASGSSPVQSLPTCNFASPNSGIISPVRHRSPSPPRPPLNITLSTILDMYNNRFSALPVTTNFPSNPFRCQSETNNTIFGYLAMAYYHMNRESPESGFGDCARFYKEAAKKQFQTGLQVQANNSDTMSPGRQSLTMDALVILFTFEASQTAISSWSHYLSCAHRLCSEKGAIDRLAGSTRFQAQLAVCIWWDVTVAMLSREPCILPYEYFERLLALEDQRQWSFFDVTGCPRGLLVSMVQLAHMASEKEQICTMRYAQFNMDLVSEIEASIVGWTSRIRHDQDRETEDIDADEETVNLAEDHFHCFEAWRGALLLYSTRVFRWDRRSRPPIKLKRLARNVIDHVRSCRLEAFISKQMLLPVILAGAELSNSDLREVAVNYCYSWFRKSGYEPFRRAGSLLETIWHQIDEHQDEESAHHIWWATAVDQLHEKQPNEERLKLG